MFQYQCNIVGIIIKIYIIIFYEYKWLYWHISVLNVGFCFYFNSFNNYRIKYFKISVHFKNIVFEIISVLSLCSTALMCIVKPDGPPMLCKTDEIGEIVLNSRAGGTMYYGLPGVTKNTFEVRKKCMERNNSASNTQNTHIYSKHLSLTSTAGDSCKLRWYPNRRRSLHTHWTVRLCGSGK